MLMYMHKLVYYLSHDEAMKRGRSRKMTGVTSALKLFTSALQYFTKLQKKEMKYRNYIFKNKSRTVNAIV